MGLHYSSGALLLHALGWHSEWDLRFRSLAIGKACRRVTVQITVLCQQLMLLNIAFHILEQFSLHKHSVVWPREPSSERTVPKGHAVWCGHYPTFSVGPAASWRSVKRTQGFDFIPSPSPVVFKCG